MHCFCFLLQFFELDMCFSLQLSLSLSHAMKVMEGARTQGATRIIGVDINDTKREKGMAFGMTDFINPRDSDKSISELVMGVTGGLGVDYSFECTGVAALVNQCIESTKIVRI